MLLEEFDYDRSAVIDPEMAVRPIDDFPEVTVSCFSFQLFNSVLSLFDAKLIAELNSAVGKNPVYEVRYKGKRFAMFQSRVGEPLCLVPSLKAYCRPKPSRVRNAFLVFAFNIIHYSSIFKEENSWQQSQEK